MVSRQTSSIFQLFLNIFKWSRKQGIIVVIKRCQWNKESRKRIKNNKRIPLRKNLSILTQNGKIANYQLTAAIQHLGGGEHSCGISRQLIQIGK